eukprot:CAMPEP_0197179040 /NCGR_PEP_ID=MMETSP1423-20130617/4116_1 /TAXON_ID=476441 /ORGANISM="Pseudo-nitzschia heimii, Strain UNC1101" /LENGTH=655 /DNA_ID=CAMNT_0042628885 /DNA_START=153 /DNA_END=2120 /DNA_ORIENTATION=-
MWSFDEEQQNWKSNYTTDSVDDNDVDDNGHHLDPHLDLCDESKCVSTGGSDGLFGDSFTCYGDEDGTLHPRLCADGYVPRWVDYHRGASQYYNESSDESVELSYFTCCPPSTGEFDSVTRSCSDPVVTAIATTKVHESIEWDEDAKSNNLLCSADSSRPYYRQMKPRRFLDRSTSDDDDDDDDDDDENENENENDHRLLLLLLERCLRKRKAIISKATYGWLKPLHDEELADLEEARIASEERKSNPFYHHHHHHHHHRRSGCDDDSDDSDDFLTTTTTSIELPGGVPLRPREEKDGGGGNNGVVVVRFVSDTNSTGHGNKVWHASIAACRYLRTRGAVRLLETAATKTTTKKTTTKKKVVVRSLELGAGTAVPSLYLAELLRREEKAEASTNGPTNGPTTHFLVRITDARRYRNIAQILRSVDLQQQQQQPSSMSMSMSNDVRLEVHPHDWGDDVVPGCFDVEGGGGGDDECEEEEEADRDDDDEEDDEDEQHDLVVVSDCIYDPEHHDALLRSLARTLALPPPKGGGSGGGGGGVAVLSFSLHGNVSDEAIWEFLEEKLPSTVRTRRTNNNKKKKKNQDDDDDGTVWRLRARCFSTTTTFESEPPEEEDDDDQELVREGWNMESTMDRLGMVTEGLAPERWLAYVYEITWVEV